MVLDDLDGLDGLDHQSTIHKPIQQSSNPATGIHQSLAEGLNRY